MKGHVVEMHVPRMNEKKLKAEEEMGRLKRYT